MSEDAYTSLVSPKKILLDMKGVHIVETKCVTFIKQNAPGEAISAQLVTEKQLCRPSGSTAHGGIFLLTWQHDFHSVLQISTGTKNICSE